MDNEPHGNSKKSQKPQHLYEIKDTESEPDTFKFGVSGQELNNDDTSPRANAQVNKLNKWAGFTRFFANLLNRDIEGREKALEMEKEYVRKFKEENNSKFPPVGQRRPNPKD